PISALQKAVVIQPNVIENINNNTASSGVSLLAARILNMMLTPAMVVANTSVKKTGRLMDSPGRRILLSGCRRASIGNARRCNLLNCIGIPDITPYLCQALIAQFDKHTHIHKVI